MNGRHEDTQKIDHKRRNLIRNAVNNNPSYIGQECEELKMDVDIVTCHWDVVTLIGSRRIIQVQWQQLQIGMNR
jgi:hypothetical protein